MRRQRHRQTASAEGPATGGPGSAPTRTGPPDPSPRAAPAAPSDSTLHDATLHDATLHDTALRDTAPLERRTTPGAGPAAGGDHARPVRLGPRSVAALVMVSAIGVAAFGWPLVAAHGSAVAAHSADAPWLFAGLLPLLVGVVIATVADTGMDAKAVAMLGMLAAAGAALRPLGAGTAGIEPMFFLMVLAGRVLGPGFGFVLGALTMFASALLTGGVGPWMPFQMVAMGWVTMGAGLLPGAGTLRGRGELALLAAYGAVSAVAYGTVMNLQGWPYLGGLASNIAYDPHADLATNLARFTAYCLTTSLGWDLPRAAVTATLCCTLGPPILRALRRATRRAAFSAPVTFEPLTPP
jgi:energy-coupling factor transport system substrate-specific component